MDAGVSRRLVEAGVVLVATLLVAGVVAGIALSRRDDGSDGDPGQGDGLTWLRDELHGDALQVNPGTGRTEQALAVADPGTPWQLAQRNGLIVVTSGDGKVTLIDIATLTALGTYTDAAVGKVLLDESNLYVADRVRGTIVRLDPADGTALGAAWRAGAPLADAVIDGAGTVWALSDNGLLHHLAWTQGALADVETPTTVGQSATRAVLVPHPSGVTVLNPSAGTVVRVGTDEDTTMPAPGLDGFLQAAQEAPVDLVPVSLVDSSTVVLVAGPVTVAVDTSTYGCKRPGRSAVHNGHVYLACRGTGRVIVLDAAGHRVSGDLTLGEGGDPELTTHGDLLFATLPGSDAGGGLVVRPDGTFTALAGYDGTVATTPPPTRTPSSNRTPRSQQPGPTTSPPTSAPPTSPPPPPGPRNGDQVIVGFPSYEHSGPATGCGPMCTGYWWYYSVSLSPPALWQSFAGTCTLEVDGIGALNGSFVLPNCSSTGIALGDGDGASYTVTVTACSAGTCVTSAAETLYTYEPVYEPYCPTTFAEGSGPLAAMEAGLPICPP